MQTLLATTPLLDYQHPTLQQLVAKRQWNTLAAFDKIQQIYNFVRDEIQFGYNTADNIAASAVLKDGYGQCNTKATLLMALLRAVGIPNRIHGFTIHKALQKGAITGLAYRLSPDDILHSWVEINYNSTWQALEGVILDQSYLTALQKQFTSCKTTFCGYGVDTDEFEKPAIYWNGNNTYIQDRGINQDFGIFDSPDAFYTEHQQQLSPLKKWIFQHVIRHQMNRNVNRIRNSVKQ